MPSPFGIGIRLVLDISIITMDHPRVHHHRIHEMIITMIDMVVEVVEPVLVVEDEEDPMVVVVAAADMEEEVWPVVEVEDIMVVLHPVEEDLRPLEIILREEEGEGHPHTIIISHRLRINEDLDRHQGNQIDHCWKWLQV